MGGGGHEQWVVACGGYRCLTIMIQIAEEGSALYSVVELFTMAFRRKPSHLACIVLFAVVFFVLN
jgi:hypothetical protein